MIAFIDKKQREERTAEWAAVGQGQLSGLFIRLREVRRQVVAEIGKPAFIVISDKSLQDLVLKRPTTLEALADVYGFGEYKAKAYGKPFIEAIKLNRLIEMQADINRQIEELHKKMEE